jgi:hypothetical protein
MIGVTLMNVTVDESVTIVDYRGRCDIGGSGIKSPMNVHAGTMSMILTTRVPLERDESIRTDD